MMKVFLSCLLLLPLSAFADTIHVDKVYLQGALVLQTPYQTDKTNMKGTTFDMEEEQHFDRSSDRRQNDSEGNGTTDN